MDAFDGALATFPNTRSREDVHASESTMAIRLVPHDPDWADIYERAAADIRGALGSTALSVDQVGSTAIPGIVAKPVVCVEILVEAYDPEAPYRGPRESLGYAFDHRDESHLFFVGSFDEIPFHVHIVEESSDSRMMIRFRDYLRAHPDELADTRT